MSESMDSEGVVGNRETIVMCVENVVMRWTLAILERAKWEVVRGTANA